MDQAAVARHRLETMEAWNNAVGAVVTSMGPQNVDTVLIAGKVMKRNGQLLPTNLDMWRRHTRTSR
jgi:5-methylthioadenosine/S-adenosylhomocysteine deaminase